MANPYFRFKQFTVYHHLSAMKVTTDACLFGAWVAAQLQKEKETFFQALDIGTGTGLLSLMVVQKNKAHLDAVEIDAGAAQQARDNFAQSPWAQKLHLVEGDVNAVALEPQYDCIISNPPFYENDLTSPHKGRNLAHHSQQLKLEQLFGLIAQKLKANGSFFLLLPFKRKEEIELLLQQKGLHIHAELWAQQTINHTPFRLLLQGGKAPKDQKGWETISIKDAAGQYTPPFVQLLQDYYLYL